jgi:hypothetical protein
MEQTEDTIVVASWVGPSLDVGSAEHSGLQMLLSRSLSLLKQQVSVRCLTLRGKRG